MAFSRSNSPRAPKRQCKQCKKTAAQAGKDLCVNCKKITDEFSAKMQAHAATK